MNMRVAEADTPEIFRVTLEVGISKRHHAARCSSFIEILLRDGNPAPTRIVIEARRARTMVPVGSQGPAARPRFDLDRARMMLDRRDSSARPGFGLRDQ